MSDSVLLDQLACPACLEPSGCASCSVAAPDHTICLARYSERVGCRCGGPDKVRLQAIEAGLECPCCHRTYLLRDGVYDFTPPAAVGDGTLYSDHEFHERLDVADNPLLLSARVKAGQMQRMLHPASGDPVLDLGCGSGRFALFAAGRGARVVGIDLAPYFLPRARTQAALVIGDLRRLPFRKAVFAGAYCLDVLEHLDEQGVRDVLLEARRVLRSSGRLFVYTHAMESSTLARFQRGVNHVARWLGRQGLVDEERERLRKSDQRNAIRSHEHFDALAGEAGLRVVARRYYNVVFKAVIEDLLLRLYEQRRRALRSSKTALAASDAPAAGTGRRRRPYGRVAIEIGRLLTLLLELDVWLFGRIRTGPFFGLLVPTNKNDQRRTGAA
jgi:ubiquinone/menaquinone biosynthesis C-methylase UbiE